MNTLVKFIGICGLLTTLQADKLYTLDQLIIQSLENSPDLHISKLEYNAAQKRYERAFSGYLPRVDLSGYAGFIGQDKVVITNEPAINDTLIEGELSIKQLLYDFGKTKGATDSQKYLSESYMMQNRQKISDKKSLVKQSYYNVLKAKALIDVQKENVKLNQAQLYRAKKYFEAGIRTKIDVSDAKVCLIQSKLSLKKAEYNLELSYADLDNVVGFFELERSYKVLSKKLNLDNLYNSLSSYNLGLKDSILYAYKNRYEIKKIYADIKASQADIDNASADYYPSIYFNANYDYQKADKYQDYIPKTKWDANINLNWNLYDGGATSSKKQEKAINANIANSQLLATKLSIKKTTTNAYINLNKTKDTVELDQNLLNISIEKFNQASKRYKYGLSDYIELQTARQGYIDAKALLVIDYYAYYAAMASLDNAIGR